MENQYQAPTRRSTALRAARIAITIVLVIGFFGPWFRACSTSPVKSGVQVVGEIGGNILQDPSSLISRNPDFGLILLNLCVLLGALSILLYPILNLLKAISARVFGSTLWVAARIVTLSGYSPFIVLIGFPALGQAEFWGARLTLVGIVGGIVTEILDIPKREPRDIPTQQIE